MSLNYPSHISSLESINDIQLSKKCKTGGLLAHGEMQINDQKFKSRQLFSILRRQYKIDSEFFEFRVDSNFNKSIYKKVSSILTSFQFDLKTRQFVNLGKIIW